MGWDFSGRVFASIWIAAIKGAILFKQKFERMLKVNEAPRAHVQHLHQELWGQYNVGGVHALQAQQVGGSLAWRATHRGWGGGLFRQVEEAWEMEGAPVGEPQWEPGLPRSGLQAIRLNVVQTLSFYSGSQIPVPESIGIGQWMPKLCLQKNVNF